MNEASTTMYATMTHSSTFWLTSGRLAWIEGRETATMVVSSMTIASEPVITRRINHLLGSGTSSTAFSSVLFAFTADPFSSPTASHPAWGPR